MVGLLSYILASVGLTILVVWPEDGPVAWFRETVIRKLLPEKFQGMLDCYICFSVWAGLILSPIWWAMCGEYWCWFGCIITPGIFWVLLPFQTPED